MEILKGNALRNTFIEWAIKLINLFYSTVFEEPDSLYRHTIALKTAILLQSFYKKLRCITQLLFLLKSNSEEALAELSTHPFGIFWCQNSTSFSFSFLGIEVQYGIRTGTRRSMKYKFLRFDERIIHRYIGCVLVFNRLLLA